MRERELRNDLREMRAAIDKYKDYADLGYLGPQKLGTNNWPETLEILVEGVKLPGPDGKKMRFLRRIPVDPFTGKAEWAQVATISANGDKEIGEKIAEAIDRRQDAKGHSVLFFGNQFRAKRVFIGDRRTQSLAAKSLRRKPPAWTKSAGGTAL
jgi:hypothetical protein